MENKFKLVDEHGKEIDVSCLHLKTNTKYLFMVNIGNNTDNIDVYLDGLKKAITALLGDSECFLIVPTLGEVGKIQKIDL